MISENIYIPIDASQRLHLKRFYTETQGPVAFLMHGAIENGKIFYSASQKGFAPYLARQGYDVFVADLRGRGESTPLIDAESSYGQWEAITEDIPLFLKTLEKHRPGAEQVWCAHSWGGVLLMSYLARFGVPQNLKRQVYFATKRSVKVQNPAKWLKIDFFWKGLAPWIVKGKGYLPARQLRVGSDNESKRSLLESIAWVRAGQWIDPRDQFDYGEAILKQTLPPILHLTGIKDRCLGHRDDVRDFINETQPQSAEFWLLSQKEGAQNNYNHIDILTSPNAPQDHFPQILSWLKNAFEQTNAPQET